MTSCRQKKFLLIHISLFKTTINEHRTMSSRRFSPNKFGKFFQGLQEYSQKGNTPWPFWLWANNSRINWHELIPRWHMNFSHMSSWNEPHVILYSQMSKITQWAKGIYLFIWEVQNFCGNFLYSSCMQDGCMYLHIDQNLDSGIEC